MFIIEQESSYVYNTSTKEIMQRIVDFIVVGSGIAGLNTALTLAPHGKVLIITKQKTNASSTFFAQGGIAAVTKKEDSIDAHVDDTLKAGYHHNKKHAVDFLVKSGANAVDKLIKYGVPFDKQQDGDYVTSYEAAHSYPRILHATDFTGQEIQKSLVSHVFSHPNIEIWENTSAIDLIVKNNTCYGISILKQNKVMHLFSRCVVLATGGAGQLFQWTTNPSVATGDGIAIAKRAGAILTDMEFIQFHPTALKGKTAQLFLLSEALRGEGAYLVDANGTRFMQTLHPLAELAPRDVVARAIFERQHTGEVYIDFRHKPKKFLLKRFPKISAELTKRGLDLSKDLIPVTPAAHFICGGVATDMHGRTSVKNLFAYGEVAATGVHGANRLASNSLLEAVVFSNQIQECFDELPSLSVISNEMRDPNEVEISRPVRNDMIKLKSIIKQIRQIMWEHVGITRSAKGLDEAMKKFTKIQTELEKIKGINPKLLEVSNMLTIAKEITTAAKNRQYSLGTHFLENYL
jgi:L-aspartate oxidase